MRTKYEAVPYSKEENTIVVQTFDLDHRFPILRNCLNSIKAHEYINKIVVVNGVKECNNRFYTPGWTMVPNERGYTELDTLNRVIFVHRTDQMFLLHDTCEIKDNSLWNKVFVEKKGINISIAPRYDMMIGKFMVKDIMTITAKSKPEFLEKFMDKFKPEVLCPEFTAKNAIHEDKWGRNNIKLVCPYMIKWRENATI